MGKPGSFDNPFSLHHGADEFEARDEFEEAQDMCSFWEDEVDNEEW